MNSESYHEFTWCAKYRDDGEDKIINTVTDEARKRPMKVRKKRSKSVDCQSVLCHKCWREIFDELKGRS